MNDYIQIKPPFIAMLDGDIPDPENRFTGMPPLTENLDGIRYRLVRSVSYKTKDGRTITVEIPFIFDWASVPRWLWFWLPPAGDGKNFYGIAALFHDWLIKSKTIEGKPIPRSEADNKFLEIMQYLNVDKHTQWVMYHAVSVHTWWLDFWEIE